MSEHKKYDLQRFLDAQERDYDLALAEIRAGRKLSHWIWYIFPQLRGLGTSHNADYYGIENKFEAFDYLSHPILGHRLRETTRALLSLARPAEPSAGPAPEKRSAIDIFGAIDAVKVRSSMTLFRELYYDDFDLFNSVLDEFYGGESDRKTLELLYGGSESAMHVTALSRDNYRQHIPIRDVVAITYAELGAMGSAGRVTMTTLSGTVYVLDTSGLSDMSDEEHIAVCPLLKDYWEQGLLPDEWNNRYDMGMGNHLFIHKSILHDFDSRIKRFGLSNVDLYSNWVMVVMDTLGTWS